MIHRRRKVRENTRGKSVVRTKPRPRLRSILSHDTVERFQAEKKNARRARHKKTAMMLFIAVSLVVAFFMSGLPSKSIEKMRGLPSKITAMYPQSVPNRQSVAAKRGKSAKKADDGQKKVEKPGFGARARVFLKNLKGREAIPVPKPAAFVNACGLWLLDGDCVVWRPSAGRYYDLPVVNGAWVRGLREGDTLDAAAPVLKVLKAAGTRTPALLERLSEITDIGNGRFELLFRECPVRVTVAGSSAPRALENVEALLRSPPEGFKGRLDASYPETAYLTEEE